MPSCLGIYTDKNMIKYAKITSVTDKMTGQSVTIDSYGVKFYDNIQVSMAEIAEEVGMDQTTVALTLSNEDYYRSHVFSNLKKKDMMDLIQNEYMESKGDSAVHSSVLEMRTKIAQNSGSIDKNLVMCVATSKGELANIRNTFAGYKIATISPLPASIKNLFPNQAIDEEAIVVNIEDKTTITVFHRSEIQHMSSISLGAQEIITKLAEKYNSTAKAYEACKKISAYISDVYDMDDESRDILDIVIPVLYDIRQQVDAVVTPYLKDARKIYITGTGAIINNIDLYFSEVFLDNECEILKPFFVYREDPNIKEIMEVNSAIALALDGVGMDDPDLDFNAAAKKAAGAAVAKEKLSKINVKDILSSYKKKTIHFLRKLNAPVKKKKKRNVAFDDGLLEGVGNASNIYEEENYDEPIAYGRIDSSLVKLATFSVAFLITYCVAASLITSDFNSKTSNVNSEIRKAEAVITAAKGDAQYLRGVADDYVEVTKKLTDILVKINKISNTVQNNFDIPNFLSELMFVMPSSVRVSSIDILNDGTVEMQAESGQYAQLGFFVSRLKLSKVLEDVDMKVVSDSGNIKIIVSGVMP